METLRFYNEAFRRGLLDPESATQSWSDIFTKYQNGQVLFSFWPWLGQSAFNTTENVQAGRGFMFAPFNEMQVFSYGANPYGSDTFIGVGPRAADPQRLVDFIDWLYSPEGVDASGGDTSTSPGPEGLTWEMIDGEPVLTDFGIRTLLNGETVPVPEEWGGGNLRDGMNQLNFPTVIGTDINPRTGFPFLYEMWPSVQRDFMTNPLTEDWRNQMNALNTMEFLRNNNKLMVAPGNGFIVPEEPSELSTLRGMIGGIVTPLSWRMVYANDAAEFDALLDEMRERAYGLGLEQLLEFDMQNALAMDAARRAAESGN